MAADLLVAVGVAPYLGSGLGRRELGVTVALPHLENDRPVPPDTGSRPRKMRTCQGPFPFRLTLPRPSYGQVDVHGRGVLDQFWTNGHLEQFGGEGRNGLWAPEGVQFEPTGSLHSQGFSRARDLVARMGPRPPELGKAMGWSAQIG